MTHTFTQLLEPIPGWRAPTDSDDMHGLGHALKVFDHDLGPLGDILLLMLALGAMWLGYRYSTPSKTHLSIRQPPDE